MSRREADNLASILIALSEMDRSVILSPKTHEQVDRLKAYVEEELSKLKEEAPLDNRRKNLA